MTPDCAYTLDNGNRCGCPALHGQTYCRHHARGSSHSKEAPSSARSATAGPQNAESEEISAAHLRAYWRTHHRHIAESSDPEFLDDLIQMILFALAEHQISHRSAGRLLGAALDRKTQLQANAQQAALRAMHDQYVRSRQAQPVEALQ